MAQKGIFTACLLGGLLLLGGCNETPNSIDPNERVTELKERVTTQNKELKDLRKERDELRLRNSNLEAAHLGDRAEQLAGWAQNLAVEEKRLEDLSSEISTRETAWRSNVGKYNAKLAFAESAKERIAKAEASQKDAVLERQATQGIILWFVVLGIPILFIGMFIAVAWLHRIRSTGELNRVLLEEIKPAQTILLQADSSAPKRIGAGAQTPSTDCEEDDESQ